MAGKLLGPTLHVRILAENAEANERASGHDEHTGHEHAPPRQKDRID